MTDKKVRLYLLLTFTISWSIAGIFYIFGGRLNQPQALPIMIVFMFIPSLSVFIVQKLIYKESVKILGINFKINKWWLLAWLLPVVASLLTFGISLLLPGIKYSPEMEGLFERYKNLLKPDQIKLLKDSIKTAPIHPFWLGIIQGLIAGVTINAIAAFGEELGWRGLLQKQLEKINFWKQSLIIGFIWGLWHLPFIIQGYNYPQHPLIGVFMMIVWTILLTPPMIFIRIKSQSVIAAAIFHGTLNGTAGLAIMLIKGGNDLTTGLLGLPGFISLALINLLLYLYLRKSPLLAPKIIR